MRKILLIGAGGGGKSVLAAQIAAETGLLLIHLDALFWKPGWVETPPDEWRRIVEELIRRDAWIMDGNYGGTLELRLGACDTVLFLDFHPVVCLWRVLKRRVQFQNKSRPDAGTRLPRAIELGIPALDLDLSQKASSKDSREALGGRSAREASNHPAQLQRA
jgi:adenylate kinase family enzyme